MLPMQRVRMFFMKSQKSGYRPAALGCVASAAVYPAVLLAPSIFDTSTFEFAIWVSAAKCFAQATAVFSPLSKQKHRLKSY
jgi:uncharacterized membrane protein